jgi:hypothetical protein
VTGVPPGNELSAQSEAPRRHAIDEIRIADLINDGE